jgi:hypothetical protein
MAKINGWTFSPTDETWTAKVGPSRWLTVPGDLADPPHFTPASMLADEDPVGRERVGIDYVISEVRWSKSGKTAYLTRESDGAVERISASCNVCVRHVHVFGFHERLPAADVLACDCGEHRVIQDDPAAHARALSGLADALTDAADAVEADAAARGAAAAIMDAIRIDQAAGRVPARVTTFDELTDPDKYLTGAGLTINDYEIIEAAVAIIDGRLAGERP